MPEVSQYQFNNKELLEILVREAGVREGKWVLMANFGVAPGNYGPSPDQVTPGIVVAVTHIGIQKAPPDSPEGTWVDAALMNPPSKKR